MRGSRSWRDRRLRRGRPGARARPPGASSRRSGIERREHTRPAKEERTPVHRGASDDADCAGLRATVPRASSRRPGDGVGPFQSTDTRDRKGPTAVKERSPAKASPSWHRPFRARPRPSERGHRCASRRTRRTTGRIVVMTSKTVRQPGCRPRQTRGPRVFQGRRKRHVRPLTLAFTPTATGSTRRRPSVGAGKSARLRLGQGNPHPITRRAETKLAVMKGLRKRLHSTENGG
jgi:hypothetical protein